MVLKKKEGKKVLHILHFTLRTTSQGGDFPPETEDCFLSFLQPSFSHRVLDSTQKKGTKPLKTTKQKHQLNNHPNPPDRLPVQCRVSEISTPSCLLICFGFGGWLFFV